MFKAVLTFDKVGVQRNCNQFDIILFVKNGIEIQFVGVVDTPLRFKEEPVPDAVARVVSTEQTDSETRQHCKTVVGVHVRCGVAELIGFPDETGCCSSVESDARVMCKIQFPRRIFADDRDIAVLRAESRMLRNQGKRTDAVRTERERINAGFSRSKLYIRSENGLLGLEIIIEKLNRNFGGELLVRAVADVEFRGNGFACIIEQRGNFHAGFHSLELIGGSVNGDPDVIQPETSSQSGGTAETQNITASLIFPGLD